MKAAPFRLDTYLDAERTRVDRALAAIVAEAPLDPSLLPALEYALSGAGKRLRPVLLVACYRAAAGPQPDAEALYRLAAAVEVVHAYSLVHDDLPFMDDDDLRRGRPTVHRAFDERTAIVLGVVMIPLAAAVVTDAGRRLGLRDEVVARLVGELAHAAGAAGMVGGQWLDLAAEGADADIAALASIHERKTGALIAGAARMGAIAAGAPAAALEAITMYAGRLGLAFQIADDVLDVTAETVTLGKQGGRDAALGKATYPALLGVCGARELALTQAHIAMRVLLRADLAAPPLLALARFAIERDR